MIFFTIAFVVIVLLVMILPILAAIYYNILIDRNEEATKILNKLKGVDSNRTNFAGSK